MPATTPLRDRFLAKTAQAENGCWEWTGSRASNGYGMVGDSGKLRQVHRVAYEIFVGPIPAGMSIDHLCRNRRCVSAEHLEAVTTRENVLRGVGLSAENARKTHCKRGHEFTPQNIYWTRNPSGPGRECRTCKALHARRRRVEV
jgi:hypothetical protein